LFVGHWQGQNENNHLAFAGGFKRSTGSVVTISRRREATRNVTPLRQRKRTPSFSSNVVVDTPCNQNENNHLAFAGGFKRSRGSVVTVSRRREAT
jgi:hypothetical protein